MVAASDPPVVNAVVCSFSESVSRMKNHSSSVMSSVTDSGRVSRIPFDARGIRQGNRRLSRPTENSAIKMPMTSGFEGS